jgi:hypothetical protein
MVLIGQKNKILSEKKTQFFKIELSDQLYTINTNKKKL